MRRRAALLAVLLAPAVVHGADNGLTAGLTLQRLSSAIPAALGGAYVAADGQLDGVFFNPASAAAMPEAAVLSTFQRGVVDDTLGSFELGIPTRIGTFYGGGAYFDAGTIDVNLSNGTNETRRAQQDMVGGIGYALGGTGYFAAGAVVKAYRLELAEESSATGAAADAGVLVRTPITGLRFGAAISNAGADVKYESESDPLPTTGRAGFAYSLDFSRFPRFKEAPYVVTVLADAVTEREAGSSGRAGLELTRRIVTMDTAGAVSLRGGYQSAPQSATAGLGFRLGSFGLDYAIALLADTDNVHRVTISWRFVPREKPPVPGRHKR